MNKKICKGYELFKMIANKELNKNCKIKDTVTDYIALWDGTNFRVEDDEGRYFTETFDDEEFAIRKFEILEDNMEEIEELGEYSDLILMSENERVLFNMIKVTTHKVDEIIRKLNKLNTNKD